MATTQSYTKPQLQRRGLHSDQKDEAASLPDNSYSKSSRSATELSAEDTASVPQTPTTRSEKDESTTKSLLMIALMFSLGLTTLYIVYRNFPQLEESEKAFMVLPRNIDDAKNLGRVLYRYKDSHFQQVFWGFLFVYIFLQSFAIPGSIFLSILSGFLFSFPLNLFTVCFCSAVGASNCYLMSLLVGKKPLKRWAPEYMDKLSGYVQRHKRHLLFYMMFLRITPFLPNWSINICSPLINVPLPTFFFGTFFGVAPPSLAFVKAGGTLYELTSASGTMSYTSFILLAVAALISLLPVVLEKLFKKKVA